MESVLSFKGVSFAYHDGVKKLQVLNKLSLEFDNSTFYAIVGESGSGKTTILSLAGALDSPQEGEIHYMGKNIQISGLSTHRRNNVSLIFQSYNLINYMTAIENVILAMDISGSYKQGKKQKAEELLKLVGLNEDEMNRNVLKLSGGQQQRVAIARALAADTGIILADEPTGNLDEDTAQDIIDMFKRLAHEYNKCVIVVTHSAKLAQQADKIYKLSRGAVK